MNNQINETSHLLLQLVVKNIEVPSDCVCFGVVSVICY
jgi:hypothetical protein